MVTSDDQNRITLIPTVCLSSNEVTGVPMEVDIRDDNSIVANGNGGNDNGGVFAAENVLGTADVENVGLDLSERSESEPENEESEREASIDRQSIQRERRLLSRGMLDTTISSIEMKRSNSATDLIAASKEQPVEGKAPFQGKRRPSVMKKKNDAGASDRDLSSRSVNFGGVEIHEHEQELCESSVPLRGPALGLGWNRVSSQTFQSVDDHLDKTAVAGGPRALNQLLLPTQQRVDILLQNGFSMRQIRSASREAGIVRTKRVQSARYSSRNKCFPALLNSFRKLFKSKQTKKEAEMFSTAKEEQTIATDNEEKSV